MSYPVYNNASLLAASATAKYKKNKGVLVVPGTSNGSVVLNVYVDPGGGTQGDAITVRFLANTSPFVFPVRVHSTGAYSGTPTVYELI